MTGHRPVEVTLTTVRLTADRPAVTSFRSRTGTCERPLRRSPTSQPGPAETRLITMSPRTHLPEEEYLRKVGLVAYLVASVEGLLLFDLPRLAGALPPELNVESLAGKTTSKLGEKLRAHASQCTDQVVAAYIDAGGAALIEIGLQRNAVLHARPATDCAGRARLYRWRVPDAYFIDDDHLDQLARRIDDLQVELNSLRPPGAAG